MTCVAVLCCVVLCGIALRVDQEGTRLSDAEESDLLSLIEMTDGGDDWLRWWRSCGHCAKRAEQSEAALGGDGANEEPTLAQKRLG